MKTAKFTQKAAMALAAVAIALACIAIPAAFADQMQTNRVAAYPSVVRDAQEQCQRLFVDEGGDGICCNRVSDCLADGQTCAQEQCQRFFVDENGDDICDNRASNCLADGWTCDDTGAKHRCENTNGQGRGYNGSGHGKGCCS